MGGDILYSSGWLDLDRMTHTDTTSQTVDVIKDIQKFLESQHLTLGDVVMMHVYLGGDPAKDGTMDYGGVMAEYRLMKFDDVLDELIEIHRSLVQTGGSNIRPQVIRLRACIDTGHATKVFCRVV
jgi:enamine deaminase RidA (YjgF/YER057c/UK114 family)